MSVSGRRPGSKTHGKGVNKKSPNIWPKALTARAILVGGGSRATLARPVIVTPSANAEVPAATDLHVVVDVNIVSNDCVFELTDITGSPPYPTPYTQTGTPNASNQVITDISGAQLQPNRVYRLRVYIDPAFGATPPNLDHLINITTGGGSEHSEARVASRGGSVRAPIDFSGLIRTFPKLTSVWKLLEEWFSQHPAIEYFYEERLMHDLSGADPVTLAVALQILVRNELLTRKFRLRSPSGTIIDGEEYDDLELIGPNVIDQLNGATLSTDALEPVTVYRLGAD